MRKIKGYMKLFIFFIQSFVCLFLGFSTLTASEEKYKLVNLDLLKYDSSEITSINNRGQICGYFPSWGSTYVFVWENGKCNYTKVRTSRDPKIVNTGEIFGSRWNWVERGMWKLDQETVYKWQNPFGYFTYFNFSDVGYPPSLISLPHAELRTAFWDANDLGQILTMNQNVINRKLSYQIWLYDKDKWSKIVHPQFQAAIKINNQSELLGYFFDDTSTLSDGNTKALRTAIYDLKEGTTQIFPFDGDSLAYDLNDAGEAVGIFYDRSSDTIKGFFGRPMGEITTIENFQPTAVNNSGQIIGKYHSGEKKDMPALYENGRIIDITEITALMDGSGNQWERLVSLTDINDRGDIVGMGIINGKLHGFLLLRL